jgi:polyisoprenoid-binding protein YceI
MVGNVTGKFNDFAGVVNIDKANPAASSVEFTIQASSIDTGNANRDQDLRSANFFEVEKYPTITFKSEKIAAKGKDSYDVTGDLTMHGVTKKVTLPVEFLGFVKDPWGNDRGGFEISTTLNRKDFNLVWNKALDQGGMLLGDDVKVNVNLEVVKKKAQ